MTSATRYLLLALTCIAGIHLAVQDDCEPGSVINLVLNGNSTLSWTTPESEQCEIAYYLVYVSLSNGTVEYSYIITETSVHVGHLLPCETYTFRVHQVSSDNITGNGWAVYSITPPPEEADLALDHLNVTQVRRNVMLRWSLQTEWIRCAKHYQVVVYDEDTDYPRDIYTGLTNIVVNNIIPCAHYKFGVRAIFTLEEEGPITLIDYVGEADALEPPTLQAIQAGTTTLDLTWKLEEFVRNRCEVKSLQISSSGFNVAQNIHDAPSRLPVSVHLSNLRPSSLYLGNVTITNVAGTSTPVLLAFQTQDS